MTQNKYQNTLNTCSQRQFSTHLNLPNVDLQFFDRREALIAGHGSTWSKAMQDNSEGWCTDATYMHTCRAQTAVPPLHSRGMFIDNEAPTRKARVEELTLIWSRPHAASLTGKLSNDCSYSFSLSLSCMKGETTIRLDQGFVTNIASYRTLPTSDLKIRTWTCTFDVHLSVFIRLTPTKRLWHNNPRFVEVRSLWCLKVGFWWRGTKQPGLQFLETDHPVLVSDHLQWQCPLGHRVRHHYRHYHATPTPPWNILEHRKHLTPADSPKILKTLITTYYNKHQQTEALNRVGPFPLRSSCALFCCGFRFRRYVESTGITQRDGAPYNPALHGHVLSL